jgi:hypothetical protein
VNGEGTNPPHVKNEATAHLAWWQVKILHMRRTAKKTTKK